MSIKFNDGVEFNTVGEYRIERRRDGYYVVGNGMLLPIDSYKEGREIIERLASKKEG